MLMTTEQLIQWQDSLLEQSKKLLLADGYHTSLAMVVTSRALVREMESHGFKLGTFDEWIDHQAQESGSKEVGEKLLKVKEKWKNEATPGPDSAFIITVPLVISAKQQLHVLRDIVRLRKKDPEAVKKFDSMLVTALQVGREKFGFDDNKAYHHIANGVTAALGLHYKDLQAYMLQKAISMSGAYAYCKIDEAWTVTEKPETGKANKEFKKFKDEHPDGIGNHPDRQECLVLSMETPTFARMMMLPFYRQEGRDTESMVTNFGNLVITDTREKGGKFEGRFTDLLKKAEKLHTPTPQA